MTPPAIEFVRDLYRQMEWADARVWQAVLRLPDGDRSAELTDRLRHIHDTQGAFLRVWSGEPRERSDATRFATRTELLDWARSWYPRATAFLATLDTERLAQPLPVPWARYFSQEPGGAGVTTLGETLFQVWAHTTAHRAQINTGLRDLGVEPPLVDYIAWIWAGRPRAEWSSPA